MPAGRPRKDTGAVLENPNRILSAEEKGTIETRIGLEKSMLGATETFGEGSVSTVAPPEVSIDRGAITKRIQGLEKVISDGSASKATGERRLKLENRRKFLEDLFEREQVIETIKDLNAIHMDSPEYRDAYRKGIMRVKYERQVQEWIQICKELEPQDPEFCKLDRLRKSK